MCFLRFSTTILEPEQFSNSQIYLQQYNTNQQSLTQLYKLFYIALNQDQNYVSNLYLQLTKTITDSGILFPDYTQYEFISDIFQQYQSISFEAGKNYLVFLYPLSLQQKIAFPNISSVLASIGSIISSLFYFSFIARVLNQRSLQEEAIYDVIKMHNPEFNDIKIKKNWLGNVKSIQNKQTNLFYNVQEYTKYYEKLTQVAEQKLCMSNVIYELSRLQFAIQQLIPKDELLKLRDKHLQIQIQTQKSRINSPKFDQEQASHELDSRIKINQNLNDDDQEQGVQQIAIDDSQDKQERQDNTRELKNIEDDFDLFSMKRYLYVKK